MALVIPTFMFADQVGYEGGFDFVLKIFCFDGDTQVLTANGPQTIKEIKIGTPLAHDAGKVTGFMKFDVPTADLYDLHGVKVSGSHIVYNDGIPMFVYEHPAARKLPPAAVKLYSLCTSSRRIPVQSTNGTILFADWEELADDDDQLKQWNTHVYQALNGHKPVKQSPVAYKSEAVLHPSVHVKMADNTWQPIKTLRPGDHVCDAAGQPTRVRGIVEMTANEVEATAHNGKISAGCWIRGADGFWSQPTATAGAPASGIWLSLVTDAGTFVVEGVGVVRDFTDVGSEHIHQTYDWVLGKLMPTKE